MTRPPWPPPAFEWRGAAQRPAGGRSDGHDTLEQWPGPGQVTRLNILKRQMYERPSANEADREDVTRALVAIPALRADLTPEILMHELRPLGSVRSPGVATERDG